MSTLGSFGDRLASAVSARESQLVLGLDPDPGELWPCARPAASAVEQQAAGAAAEPQMAVAAAVLAHCRALIDATAQSCVAVKPQLARFEVLGPQGWQVLREVLAHARSHGLLVIADGKRGDIDVTAAAYAAALTAGLDTPFGHIAGLGADLMTVNPLMGRDAILPFVQAARANGAGVLLLVRTSNAGAADVEDLELPGGGALWERLARLAAELGAEGVGESGLCDVGAVMGATAPWHLERARELMPAAPFLLPGIGAQGGRVEDLQAAFRPGPAGGLLSASRSIAGAHAARGGDPEAAAAQEAERLRGLAWRLAQSP
ncbi:MAG: orotidine-5'-phosphate decarboxylase [Solirubrobacteraceae bacterium]